MRLCISIRGRVRPSVHRSVRPTVRPTVRPSVRPSVGPSVGPSIRPLRLLKNRENRRNKAWEMRLFDSEDYLYRSREATADTTPTTASHTATIATTATTITLLSSQMPKADNDNDEMK